jgi:glycosyltransferase involved in cell wall biosynthesis
LEYLFFRTPSPAFRLIVIDNGSKDGTVRFLQDEYGAGRISQLLLLYNNVGIHTAKNYGLMMVRSTYYVDTDNDILVPKYEKSWLSQLWELMRNNPEYAAIAMRPQILVGHDNSIFQTSDSLVTMGHCGASMRIMDTQAVRDVGGWDWDDNRLRNNEEKWICSKLREKGRMPAYATQLRCYHQFGENWGYGDIPKEEHGHRDIWPRPEHYDNLDKLNPDTFEVLQ